MLRGVQFREAKNSDADAMVLCREGDPTDPRMKAYFEGHHHPGQALPERVGYVATIDDAVIGYIAGHRTTRHGCDGELQYLFVAAAYRRQQIAATLLRSLAHWFSQQGARKICVAIAADSPPEAKPFVETLGATPLKNNWYAWQNIEDLTPVRQRAAAGE